MVVGILKKKKHEQLESSLHIIGKDAKDVSDTFETAKEETELDYVIEHFDVF